MDLTHPLNIRVEQAFAAWRDKRQDLQETSQKLERALEAFARGNGPEPAQLRLDLERLRSESDQLFLELSSAVRTAQAAGVR